VVENVEELASESEPHLLGEVKMPLQRKIHLRGSETSQHIAPEIALLSHGGYGESCFVENLAASVLRP
jgi:hypothetical protein